MLLGGRLNLNTGFSFEWVTADHLPNNFETVLCCVSICCARSYPRNPKRDNSNNRCCETSAPSVCAFGTPPAGNKLLGGTVPGDGTVGASPTKKIK